MEGGAEVRAIDAIVAGGFRVVQVLAFRAVEFHVRGVRDVVLAGGEQMVGFADDARAFAEDALFVLLHLQNHINTQTPPTQFTSRVQAGVLEDSPS